MSEFDELRKQIAAARAQRAAAAGELTAGRERRKIVTRELGALARTGAGGHAREALEKEREALDGRIAHGTERLAGASAAVGDLLGRLAALATPEQQITELADDVPILLFPVRLETRFRAGATARAAAAIPPHLAIRIYPDTCQIDGFEDLLTESEIQSLRAFWIATWRAGGVEAQRRGAWRALVGGSGSGRAAYAIGLYAPTNPADAPTKVKPEDVILVIAPAIAVTDDERGRAIDYWTAVWHADGDAALEADALDALRAAIGDDARTRALVEGFAPDPAGWDPPAPHTRAGVALQLAVIALPPPPAGKTTSWTQSPKAAALPDRFVALLYRGGALVKTAIGNPVKDGLATGPDPSLPPDQQIKVVDEDLVLNDDLRWTGDFAAAVAVGMAIDVPLTAEDARAGFDRLLVVGVRFSADEAQSKDLLEALIAHQFASKGGYGLVPQGSPTNNTESGGAAFSWVDDPDASFDRVFLGADAYPESADPLARRDGQWLAEALGIDDALVKRLPHAAGLDQVEARAMNIALWNGTLGYMMEEMMSPLFSRADIAATRLFFTRFVSGRGPVPGIRVGDEPYGVLPALAFSRYRATQREVTVAAAAPASYLQRLHTLLARMDGDWRAMLPGVAHVGRPGDAHQTLLDIVGLHPGTVEYHQRYAESFDQLYNKLVLELGPLFGGLLASWLRTRGRSLLTRLGADPAAEPAILEKFFWGRATLLDGPLVDDVPLSETAAVRGYAADGKNYLEWLASAPLDAIRRQDFGGKPAPIALLYLMLRHAMMLGHWDAGIRFLENRGLIDAAVARAEPSFIHVQAAAGESKFARLYQPQPAVTGDATTLLADYVIRPAVLATAAENEDLREIVGALGALVRSPTARLERVFAEHVDCCTYRLDAWKTGLAAARLAELRARRPTGLHLGAFGWIENLRPRTTQPRPQTLEGDLAKTFQRQGDAPLTYDPSNAGFLHAPSLNQAAAAAILENAYRVNATPANPDAMAVNLSSQRVRNAQTVLEGMRNGQSLSALLGYRFERGLHDEHALAEVDKFIYPLRQVFPLVANQLRSTRAPDADITLLEARNVVDGLALVSRARTPGRAHYPFGFPLGTGPGQLPPASGPESTAIDTEVDRLLDLHDALGDLVLSESVYQVVLGNFDRAAAVATALGQGSHPPEIQVVDTPRTGRSLSHRVALHLDPAVDRNASPTSFAVTPRSRAEAPLNAWLHARLPDPANVVVEVSYATPALGAPGHVQLSQADLGLQPIDLLYGSNLELEQAMAELDDRIVQIIRYGAPAHPQLAIDAHPAADIEIAYTTRVPGKVTFFELAALVRQLRALVLKSRAVRPADMLMPLEARSSDGVWSSDELAVRVQEAIAALGDRRAALAALVADGADLDDYARKVTDELLRAARHGVPQTGTGDIHADLRAIYDAIASKLGELVARWDGRAADYDSVMATWPALTTDADRFAMLKQAERLIAAVSTSPVPADPDAYRAAIEALRGQFDLRLGDFAALLAWSGTKLVDFVAAVDAALPGAAPHDLTPFDLVDQKAAMATLRDRIVARVVALVADLDKRIADATAVVAAAGAGEDRVQALLGAARRVLGDEIQLVPRFVLPHDGGNEFAAALASSASLVTDLVAAGRAFPVDDWLYGLARVRDKAAAWEGAAVLAEAFGAAPAELTPVQLPNLAGDRWMALEFDPRTAPPGDRVLYTAHFATGFTPSAEQCGLLLDEWPEVIPDPDVMSGIAFHFDRPSSAPPQALLLALPAVRRGRWTWDDLIGAITETLEGAKTRAVEPAQIDASSYAQVLPGTLMAVTLYWITIATNLALNKNIYSSIGGA